jgi:hypothetical protein
MGRAVLEEIARYHNDVVDSLGLYFSEKSPDFLSRFSAYSAEEVQTELTRRLEETELRSAFVILTIVEAAFRLDYKYRCEKKLEDDLSRAFRAIHRSRKNGVRLDEDIFETWRQKQTSSRGLIGDLRGAFKFRHWIAHGRYWEPKLGRKYDFDSVYDLADIVFGNLSLLKIP